MQEQQERTIIQGQRFGEERALYHAQNVTLRNCRFEGEEDGESALKEARNVRVEHCYMQLRYPFWHVHMLEAEDCTLTEHCRAALWYSTQIRLQRCVLDGIKALRECDRVQLVDCVGHSPEFGWRCEDVTLQQCSLTSEYAFLQTKGLYARELTFEGKYSFQYTQDVVIEHSRLNTKDAFWHAKNVTVKDSILNGEYLGWYSEGLTLVRCHIKGTQPFCYCKRLKLIDCTMEDCDLAFEYSEVEATVQGSILSVKNPLSGKIVADGVGEIIRTADSVYPSRADIVIRR